MTTLSDVMLSLAEYCLPVQRGACTTADSSSPYTALIDETFLQSPGQYTSGVLFFLSGAHAGKFVLIENYDGATGEFTVPNMGATIAVGVQYAAFALKAGMNLYDLIHAVNQALRFCGEVLYEDTTSLTTVADQEEYDIQTDTIDLSNIRRVEIATSLTTPYNYRPHTHWDEINGTLRFQNGFRPQYDGYKMRITYKTPHPTLDSYDDIVSYQVNPDWLLYTAALNLFRSLANRGVNTDSFKMQYEEASQRVITMRPLKMASVMVKGA